MDVVLEYVSGGINPQPNCLDIIESRMIMAYASANVIIIGIINKAIPSFKHLITLNNHRDDVRCIKIFENDSSRIIVLSGDIKGNLYFNHIKIEQNDETIWNVTLLEESLIKKPYEMPIIWITISNLTINDTKECFIAVGSSEPNVQIYKLIISDTVIMDEYAIITNNNNIILSCSFVTLRNSGNPLFLVGNNKGELLVYTFDTNDKSTTVNMVCSICHHNDWLKVVRVLQINDLSNKTNDNHRNKESTNIFYVATAGQDGLIVIYQLVDTQLNNITNSNQHDLLEVGSFMWDPYHDIIGCNTKKWYLYKQSVLNGHGENRITDICWFTYHYNKNLISNQNILLSNKLPPTTDEKDSIQDFICPYSIELISTAEDRNIIIWCLEKTHTNEYIWLDKIRFGMLNVHNNFGYFGCSTYRSSVLTYGYDGAIYLWKPNYHNNRSYELFYLISGHTNSVESINWEKTNGNFLITCSKDNTCRIFVKHFKQKYGYCEMSRPQIHGFGINNVRILPNGYIASAAHEKMIRIFMPPQSFYRIYGKYVDDNKYRTFMKDSIPIGGILRPLGLSNKAIYESDLMMDKIPIEFENNSLKEYGQVPSFQKIDNIIKNRLLNEERLQQSTLWPEYDKLYGHGNEILVLEVNFKLNLLASACIATNKETAEIIIWDIVENWSIKQRIQQHKLTVTALKFSPDGYQLLSVSRDRTWSIYYYLNDEANNTTLFVKKMDSTEINIKIPKHTRIIWDCSWSYNGEYFATGSRDNNVIIWKLIDSTVETFSIKHTHAITSLAFNSSPNNNNTSFLLVIGDEIGQILLYNKISTNFVWSLVYTIPKIYCPGKSINDISWKPCYNMENNTSNNNCNYYNNQNNFAVTSSDHSLRIYNVQHL